MVTLETVIDAIVLRSLRLNCVTATYAPLWRECFHTEFLRDTWTANPKLIVDCRPLGPVGEEWTPEVPLRVAVDRRQALLEIDALVALGLGITADELVTIYRTQFPVLYGYDTKSSFYDANGRLVPTSILTLWRERKQWAIRSRGTHCHSFRQWRRILIRPNVSDVRPRAGSANSLRGV